MRAQETTVYKFDELSDQAKEKARQWYRDGNLDYEWWDSVYSDADEIAKILGITLDRKRAHNMKGESIASAEPCIWFSGFYSQGDGACFEGYYEYAKGAAMKHARPGQKITIREYAPQDKELHRIADGLRNLQRRNFYKLTARVRHRGYYYHSLCTEIDVDGSRDNATDDELSQLLRDFMDWIYRSLERESEWLNANEQVDESIRANEYEFESDGSLA